MNVVPNNAEIRLKAKAWWKLTGKECRARRPVDCSKLRLLLLAIHVLALAGILAGCVASDQYSEWQWRQYNPEWRSLPGQPDR